MAFIKLAESEYINTDYIVSVQQNEERTKLFMADKSYFLIPRELEKELTRFKRYDVIRLLEGEYR